METGAGGAERLDSQNLRDFLRVKQEDHQSSHNRNSSGRNLSGMTLNVVLSDKRAQARPIDEPLERVQSNRTLLDIIREESGGGAYKDGKKSWRHFKDKLRLHRNGSGSNWTSSVRIPASDIPLNNNSTDRMMTTGRRSFTQFGDSPDSTQPNVRPSSLDRNSSRAIERASGRFEHTSSLAMRRLQREPKEDEEEEREEEDEEEESGGGSGGGEDEEEEEEGGQQPVRTSLMALLAETDRQMGLDGLGYILDEEEEEEEDEEEERGVGGGGEYNSCCVCMVRHKGAAFIPCGHTFCRLCSRELYAQRGNCPLCNNYILEILDIF